MSFSQNIVVDKGAVKKVVNSWSDAHNNHSHSVFSNLYLPNIMYYGKDLAKERCIKSKFNLLESGDEYEQSIIPPLSISVYDSGLIKCHFDKQVTKNGVTKTYPSYLLLRDIEGEYKIAGESDDITDVNLNYTPILGSEIDFELVNGEKLLHQPSKVKGLSKMWLWIVVLLLGGMVIFGINFRKIQRKLKEKPKVIVKKEVEKHVHYVNDETKTQEEIDADKGKRFEEYVVNMFMNKKEYFEWIDKTPDIKLGVDYPKSNMNPDLIMKFKNNNRGWEEKIAVECKYRAGHVKNEVFIDDERKLQNYRSFQDENDIKTFLALGFGGKPDKPKRIFVLPIEKVNTKMQIEDLELFTNRKSYFFYDYNKKTLT